MSEDASESRWQGWWGRVKSRPQRWREFLHEVRVEMRQVTWPSRRDVIATTGVVIVAVGFFGFFFFAVDNTVGFLLQRMLRFFGQ